MSTGALSIKLRCASWQQLSTIYKRDLSKGTMFLKASAPPPVGTLVRIDLTLPSGSVIVLNGVVQAQVSDAARGAGVELKLAPIPTGSIWLIESALDAEKRRAPTSGVPVALPPNASGPVVALDASEGGDLAAAEADLTRALHAEAESLKKLNPFLVLGVGYEASDSDVRTAFGELTKRYHPDRFTRYESTELRAIAAEIFILIRDAYRKLGDEAGRAQQLATIARPKGPPPPPKTGVVPTMRAGGQRIATAQIPVLRTQALPTVLKPPAAPQAPPPIPSIPSIPKAAAGKTQHVPALHVPPAPTTSASVPSVPLGAPPAAPVPVATPSGAATHGQYASVVSPLGDLADPTQLEELLDAGRFDEALAGFKAASKKHPSDRVLRAGVELCEGLLALAVRDRLEAAQRFETALEIDPSNERAARELADMRRQATNERKGLLSRLMGKRES